MDTTRASKALKRVSQSGGSLRKPELKSVQRVAKGVNIKDLEEASTAMEEGRLAGLAAAESLGYLPPEEGRRKMAEVRERMTALRIGSFGEDRAVAKEQIMRERYGA